jgi:Ca-activated chloride channel family protein
MAKTTLTETKPLGQLVVALRTPLLGVAGEMESALPLEHTAVTAQVTGLLVSVAVTQRFGNPLSKPTGLDYLFPLPHEAAITDFELRIGQRNVRAEIKELEQARATYEEAQKAGQRAGLLEQRRPNLFAVRLANVLPGETVLATVRYQQRLKLDSGWFEFVYPMGLTPKYGSPTHPDESIGVQAPIAKPGEVIGAIELSLSVDAGVPVGEPTSPSHPIEINRIDEHRFQVRLAGEHIPDHDFVLRYAPVSDQVSLAAWVSADKGGDTFLATLLPPTMEAAPQPSPRQFIFVLDRSGSMSGEPIAQARNALRACLRALNPGDTFLILLFDDQLEWYRASSTAVTQEEVDRADAFLEQIEGRGGTEIVQAIEAALDLLADQERTRFVVFLTDGAVSAESRALDQVKNKLGSARLFTFGIGPSVNRALLSSLARLGRGTAEFLQSDEDIEGAIIRFQDRVSFPALTDLSLKWQDGQTWDVYPTHLPDLYIGQPLDICGRLKRAGANPVTLTLCGRRGTEAVNLSVLMPIPAGEEPLVGRAWGRARVDDLLEQTEMGSLPSHQGRAEIISLALEQRLVTPFTAFVAVDQDVANRGGSGRVIYVAQPLPQGLVRDAFGSQPLMSGAVRQTMFAVSMSQVPPPLTSPSTWAARPNAPSRMPAGERMLSRDISDSMEVPAFLKNRSSKAPVKQPPAVDLSDREALLRQLARTQKLDGSWNEDVETTAAALLAFVRAGHTTKGGSFRQGVLRAFKWLAQAKASRFAASALALALAELAQATGQADHQAAAQAVRLGLGAGQDRLETAVLTILQSPANPGVMAPTVIKSLDDLRLAAVLKAALPVPHRLLRGNTAALILAWAAAGSSSAP